VKEPIVDVTATTLLDEVVRKKAAGWRLVALTAVPSGEDAVEVLYHFDLNLVLSHLRLRVARNGRLPSISPVYFAAFLVENEIQDQFELGFDGLVLDYDRTLFLEEEVRSLSSPFFRAGVVKKTPGATVVTGEA